MAHFTKNKKLKRNFNIKNRNQEQYQNCKKCVTKLTKFSYKPERAHHCSICNICITKMDHHCPFISNCVGIKNYRFYFQLLFYGTISLLIVTILILRKFYLNIEESKEKNLSNSKIILKIFSWTVLSFFFIIFLGGCATLFFRHCYQIAKDITTIEDIICEEKYYDFGIIVNFKNIFGNFFYFFLPIHKYYKYEGFFYWRKVDDIEYDSNPVENINFNQFTYDRNDILDMEKIIFEDLSKKKKKKFVYIFDKHKFYDEDLIMNINN